MFNDITKPPPPLPQATAREISPELSLLNPLTRRGHGPGLIVLLPPKHEFSAIREGVPSIPFKWAEEGYAVVGVSGFANDPLKTLQEGLDALSSLEKCEPKGSVGLVSYNPSLWEQAATILDDVPEIVATVIYADIADKDKIAKTSKPILQHLAGPGEASPIPKREGSSTTYLYTKSSSHKFAIPFQDEFHYGIEALSHTRNLQFLKPIMQSPYFDLEAVWEEHTYYEFADRSVEHTMSTMVQEPYVNHVPTLTGGIGRSSLTSFYRHNFIFNNSADTSLELLSRTVGIDRIIDEFIFRFTHDGELDWLLPGVPPTHRKVAVPFTAVVNIRGDRLYHEHIGWDQSTVLVQLGLMPEYLPFPYPLPNASESGPRRKVEYRVPVGGYEVTAKMIDRNSVPSNEMLKYKVRELD